MKLKIHVDGGARGNPGPAAAGVVIADAADDQSIFEAGYWLGRGTNNFAEYSGLIKALEKAGEFKPDTIEVYSDSQLMVLQINGQYRVKSKTLKPLFEQAIALLEGFDDWTISHVYRESNVQADKLANMAMDRKADVMG